MEKLGEPVSCGCQSQFHENPVINTVIPNLSAQQVFEELKGNRVLSLVQQMKQTKDLVVSNWTTGEPPTKWQRQISYTMPVNVPLAPASETKIVDAEMILEDGPNAFIMEKHSVAPHMPYSDDFVPMIRFCIFNAQHESQAGGHVSAMATKLLVSVWIRWLHKPMLVKGKIDQVTLDGLKQTAMEYGNALQQVLQKHIPIVPGVLGRKEE